MLYYATYCLYSYCILIILYIMAEIDTIKHILIKSKECFSKIINPNKVKRKRLVSNTEKWKSTMSDNCYLTQFDYISDISNINDVVMREIKQKIIGYKSQDKKKGKYCCENFIDYAFVINLFHSSLTKCFYCNELVSILYEDSCDPKQWTIERIDNDMGHDKDNVVIACLNCNLRRRTIYFQRYVMTKQLKIVKK
jgi:hypothetical protein